MTFLEAALAVLNSAERPMTTNEITEEAIRRGLLSPHGKTPVASMAAVLYQASADKRGQIERCFEPGTNRARRGSVRWALK